MNIIKARLIIVLIGLMVCLAGGVVTAAAQTNTPTFPTPAPSETATASETQPPTPTLTATPLPKGTLITLQIANGEDDVNESSGVFDATKPQLWVGNGGDTSDQYLGLRFNKVAIPAGSIINAAHLEVYSSANQWISLNYDLAAEAADNSKPFTGEDSPAKRKLTTAVVHSASNITWSVKTLYPLDEIGIVVQQVISRSGWKMGNSLSIIAIGTVSEDEGGQFGRKFFTAYEADPDMAARLVIDFSPGKTPATTATSTQTATPEASLTPAATLTLNPCSDISLPTRLKVGQTGQVVVNPAAPTTPVNVRDAASTDANRIGRLAPGIRFTVIDGPTCVDDVAWFKVQYGDQKSEGWLAEGQSNFYFVQPVK